MTTSFADRYVCGELLGTGGMGKVFAATDPHGRQCALKLLDDPHVGNDQMVARLLEEGAIGSRIKHKNVVRVHDHGIAPDGNPYLVMDRVPGIRLTEIIGEHGALPLARIRSIVDQLLAGLGAIHALGLVHGDIKSDNVMVDPANQDRTVIIDLGLVCPIGAGTENRMVSGTPEYMAPEVIRGEPHSPQSDLYAVGVIVYELLTGTSLFGGGTASMVFDRHLYDEVMPPSVRSPNRVIPAALESVVMRALSKDPAARHYNAGLFAATMERALFAHVEHAGLILPRRQLEYSQDPTKSWAPRPRRRLATGTMPRDSAPVAQARAALDEAQKAGEPDPIIVGYLELVGVLLSDRRLGCAAQELEIGIEMLRARADGEPPALWRLVLSLAAIHDGLGDHAKARFIGAEARDLAVAVGSDVGIERASDLLRRVGVAAR